tara:strand:- start:55 stop:1038 length:984 start_codon:yes stop_codon:yes gene_type:complete
MLLEMIEEVLGESRNTLGADINEILLALIASDSLGGNTSKFVNYEQALQTVNQRKTQLTSAQKSAELEIQSRRAIEMFKEIEDWRRQNGFDGEITRVWWTARPNILLGAVPDASPGNPTDVLYEIAGSKGTEYLGISAKSSKANKDIAFKNPGAGTIAKILNLNSKQIINSITSQAVKTINLPTTAKARKAMLKSLSREDPIRLKTDQFGSQIENLLRDELLLKLQKMSIQDARQHLSKVWLDAEDAYPFYIKCLGYGVPSKNYGARVFDPINNDKYKALMSQNISFEKSGQNSIGVSAGNQKIMKIRYKYESTKLATSMKLSGEPW